MRWGGGAGSLPGPGRQDGGYLLGWPGAGYTAVLSELIAFDAPGALIAYLRTRLGLKYSLPHNTIYFRDDTGALVPLPEDWKFPTDPWAD